MRVAGCEDMLVQSCKHGTQIAVLLGWPGQLVPNSPYPCCRDSSRQQAAAPYACPADDERDRLKGAISQQ